ncbi:nucleotide-diphospho-sugar transferase [Tribonema minus]|uniref:Translation initiation factor eIF2B subunit epsilon n=1 Tax=Tribonema minus TaxID=303371 RepID=A0A835YX04_9STRA|nr:nucleotide-diphospho-sugar transferase [Tribonema minus]
MAKGKAKGGGDEHQQQDDQQKVQAVLLADSFNTNFRPISYEMPKVLCPLVNTPMIDYTLELLASNGVQEVFVFCVNHAQQLSEYLSAGAWGDGMEVRCVTSTNCLSAGDALRELDQMGIVHGDPFVLIHGDVVSTVDLKAVLRAHKEAKKKDPSKIMTMCFKQAGPNSRLRPLMNDLVVGLDRDTQQVVLFNNSLSTRSASLPLEAFKDHAQIEFRSDLLDCYIDICSPEVLVQISDNFDYQDLRQHFVTNEVANVELGNKIMAHIVGPREYSARVEDLRLYHAVSRDIIRRWTYPLVPDNAVSSTSSGGSGGGGDGGSACALRAQRGYVYRHRGVTLPRSVSVGAGTVIGPDVAVGEGAVLSGCVLGAGARIGAGARVTDSYVWEGAEVGEGARVEGAVLAAGSRVGARAAVPMGCVLGAGVALGGGVALPPFTRLTCIAQRDAGADGAWGGAWGSTESGGGGGADDEAHDGGDAAAVVSDVAVVGEGGRGRLWLEAEEGEDEGWDSGSDGGGDSGGGAGAVDIGRCRSIGCHAEEAWRAQRWSSFDLDDEIAAAAAAAGDNFHQVIRDMLVTGSAEGHPIDNLLLEIKGYKFAQNRSFAECIRASTEAVLDLAGCGKPDAAAGMPLVAAVREQLQLWKTLLSRLAQNAADQVEVIMAVEQYALRPGKATPLAGVFRFILQLLYDTEVVSEEGMEQWIALRRSGPATAPEMTLFNAPQTQEFIAWLEDEEEESDDEDEDDDDDE